MSGEWESVKAEFKEWYRENEKSLCVAKDLYTSLVAAILSDKDEFANPQIESRVKDWRSCCTKFEKKYLNDFKDGLTREDINKKLTDIIGIRVICSYEDEIKKIADVIEKNFSILDETDKTAELHENEFGYKGLHFDVELHENRKSLEEYIKISKFRVEIQIRTQIQHAWSFLDHKIKYKHNDDLDYDLKRSVNRLAALFELADKEFIRIRDEIKNNAKTAIENAENSVSTGKTLNDASSLDFATFVEFLRYKNPKYIFYEERQNLIFAEIKHLKPEINIGYLTTAYNEKSEIVENYKESNVWAKTMNPYTTLRHILYAYDNNCFKALLMPIQQQNFDTFITREIR